MLKRGSIVKINPVFTIGNERCQEYYGLVIFKLNGAISVMKLKIAKDGKGQINKEKATFFSQNNIIKANYDFSSIISMDIMKVAKHIGDLKEEFVTQLDYLYLQYAASTIKYKDDLGYWISGLVKQNRPGRAPAICDNKVNTKITEYINYADDWYDWSLNDKKEEKTETEVKENSCYRIGDVYLINFELGHVGYEINKIRYGIIIDYDHTTNLMSVLLISTKRADNHIEIVNDSLRYPAHLQTRIHGYIYPEQIKVFDTLRNIKYIGHLKHEVIVTAMYEIYHTYFAQDTSKMIHTYKKRMIFEKQYSHLLKGFEEKQTEIQKKTAKEYKFEMFDSIWNCFKKQ